jgi:hypothetical protein
MIIAAFEILESCLKQEKGVVLLIVKRVISIANAFPGAKLREKLDGLRVEFQWSAGVGGTGAYYDSGNNRIVIECGPNPTSPIPLTDYNQIPDTVRSEIWDQFLFEFRNFYNAPQIQSGRQVGLYGNVLQAYGDAITDVECITWVLYVGDLCQIVRDAPPNDRLPLAQGFSTLAKRAVDRYVQQVNANQATPVALMNLFRNSPHGGPGAQPNSREALDSPILYTIERIERLDSDNVNLVIATRVRAALAADGLKLAQVVAQVVQLRLTHPAPGPNAVADLDALITAARQDWSANAGVFQNFLNALPLDLAYAGQRNAVDQALQLALPNAATVNGAALPNLPLNPAPAPVLTQQLVDQFRQAQVPQETALTTALRARDGNTFKNKARGA